MNKMPFDDHRKQNDTIHSRIVRRRRPGASSSNTVTRECSGDGGAAGRPAGGASAGIHPAVRSIASTVRSASSIRPRLSR